MGQRREYDIFISYRRLDEQGNISGRDQAHLIAKQLELEGFHPFFDYSEIKDNEFDKVIIPAVEKCKVFILVLTKDALNRCKNGDDWVRREIETAIKYGRKVINVSPDNSFNGWPDSMPESLYGIKNIQISEIHFGSLFELSMKKLIEERVVTGLKNDVCVKFEAQEENIIQINNNDTEQKTHYSIRPLFTLVYLFSLELLLCTIFFDITNVTTHWHQRLYTYSNGLINSLTAFVSSQLTLASTMLFYFTWGMKSRWKWVLNYIRTYICFFIIFIIFRLQLLLSVYTICEITVSVLSTIVFYVIWSLLLKRYSTMAKFVPF